MPKNETFVLFVGLKNPLTLMSYVTPVMAIATLVGSLIFDPWDEFRKTDYFNSSWHIVRSCLLMFFGGTLAFFMVTVAKFNGIYFCTPVALCNSSTFLNGISCFTE